MKILTRTGWLLTGAFGVVLTLALALLYVRTQESSASSYFESVATVRQIKQLDARWELDVMKSKMGIISDYDALAEPLVELNHLQGQLHLIASMQRHEATAAFAKVEKAFSNAIFVKTRMIERFKSHNSVLRNSLVFLPTAASDSQNEIRSVHHGDSAGEVGLSSAVNAVLLDTMVFSHSPSSEAATAVASELAHIDALEQKQPLSVREGLDVFAAHARTVLREQPMVNDLLQRISSVPTTARIDEFDRLLGGEQKRVEQRAGRERQYLIVFAAALVALLLFAAVRLFRSHALINRINRNLHDANTGLEQRVGERTRELVIINGDLTSAQGALRNLLDNSDQGFLTVGPDLLIGEQSSAACEAMLGGPPAGRSILALCRQGMPPDAEEGMLTVLRSVFHEPSEFVRDLKLGLLRTEFLMDGRSIDASYKFLSDSGQLMLVLTDVTQTTLLKETVERERQRLEMVVFAVTEGEAFAALVNDYTRFLADELPLLFGQIETCNSAAGELRRLVHTYKGLLAQFSFHHSPHSLHQVETRFSADTRWTAQSLREAFGAEALRDDLRRDLAGLSAALGPDFMPSGRDLALSQQQLLDMKDVATSVLAAGEFTASKPLRQFLRTLASLGQLDVKTALSLHSRGAVSLASRLEKQLMPIRVLGDAVLLPPELYGEFFRSLVHVFRNAVDHGIESPEERVSVGKPPEGTICCEVCDRGGSFEILIEDDGRGVDRAALQAKFSAAEGRPLGQGVQSLENLIFREGLSSRSLVSEVSGRGIGLSAVMGELDRL
ncbi:MAG: CheA signal transduction histidine kinase, partial [Bryobacterales bacterium]|nr:CheA signal transduction histidine kinase [Bryobacterales bacterium]